jgi:hypothetical protein
MWKRNLLFLGLLGAGVFALGANLLPPRQPRPVTRYDASAYQADDFRDAVARVDASFRNDWAKKKLEPAPAAPNLAVARRLALGLMGTVPSLEEIRQFEYLPADERLPWWIDHVLQDRRSADYLAERFARAIVGVEGGPFIFYRRRRFVGWLADQLARSRPYDHIVQDILMARGLWTNEPATNFITVTGKQDKQNQPDPIRLAGRVTRAFLGLRLDCAECHNHPFSHWKQTDFQSLAAFFGQTRLGFTGIHDGKGEFEYTKPGTKDKRIISPRVPFAIDLLPQASTRRERLATWVTHARNPYFAKAAVNRVWALMLGRPLVDPVDNIEPDPDKSAPPQPAALQLLADDFAEHGFDLRRLVRVIASTEVFRLDSATEREPKDEKEKKTADDAWAVFPLTRLRGEQVVGGLVQSSSVTTIDADSHIFVRLARLANHNDFLKRYGDTGEDEFEGRGGTIPQRLLMMNGTLIRDRIKAEMFIATARIAAQARDASAVEAAYLTVLTRRPTAEESEHFEQILARRESTSRGQRLEDLFWALINSSEFSWNH